MKRLVLSVGCGILIVNFAYGSNENAGTSVVPFLKLGASTRSAGMGGVSVAVCRGVDGSNPASLANLKSKEMLFMRHQWLEEVNFNYLAGVLPLKNQGIGASFNFIGTGDQKKTTYLKPDGDGNFETGGMVLTVGYGRRIKGQTSYKIRRLWEFDKNYGRRTKSQIQAGASIKYISQKLDDKTGTGIGMDVGTLYQTRIKGLTVGCVIQNLSLSKMKFIEKEESLPMVIKAGCGYKIKDALLGIDISKPNDDFLQFNLGGEYQITPIFAIRAGYDSSIDEGTGITAGFGVSHQNLTFDTAYLPAGDLGSTFRISASMRF